MQGGGNDRFASDCLILKDKSPASLELLQLRANEIAGVIVNPIAGFGWKNAGTAEMMPAAASQVKAGQGSIEQFRVWLCKLRETCTQSAIPLIFDETWAFHLGPGGAQEFYGVEADLLVLGKSVGGGHAVGAVVGPSRLMDRRDADRPMRVNFAVGTFKGNPVVMGAMNAALKYVTSPEAQTAFNGLRDRVSQWVDACNATLSKQDLPISVAAHRSTWCIKYHQPSAYQFMFQYYLRDAGLQMAWVGTSKMLFSLEFSEADFKRLTEILVTAATAMKADGWWEEDVKPLNIATLWPLFFGPTVAYHLKAIGSFLGLTS
jgi:glutamate-1-semialdehyde 2,1-aminomutase